MIRRYPARALRQQLSKPIRSKVIQSTSNEPVSAASVSIGRTVPNSCGRQRRFSARGAGPLALALLLSCAPLVATGNPQTSVDEVLDMSLGELLSMEVTSVAKRPQMLRDAAAAIHVITREDIERSGVTSIPEALRLAPGIQVARINAHTWAISARGFNSTWSNKLLVLIDGRSVYVPSFSGVFWEQQDLVLPDIERIEVVRGPGATLWGANAVNGVINILTRHSADTENMLVGLSVGSNERSQAELRIGTRIADLGSARVYIKHQDTQAFADARTGGDARDDWHSTTAGFRADGRDDATFRWRLQGDIYRLSGNQFLVDLAHPEPPYSIDRLDRFEADGWNLVGLVSRDWAGDANTALQVYVDHVARDEFLLDETFRTVDFEIKHQFGLGERHRLVAGLGYRNIRERFDNSDVIAITPRRITRHISSVFLQDEFDLFPDRLRMTLGAKVEHNDRTGAELQPNIRLLWHPASRHTFWTAVSKAVRTPAEIETNSRIITARIPLAPPPASPPAVTLNGNPGQQAEVMVAYEAGYRAQPTDSLSIDVAAFFNDYDRLSSTEAGDTPLDTRFGNGLEATAIGLETTLDWRIREWWRLQASYTHLEVDSGPDLSGLNAVNIASREGLSPAHQYSLRSSMDLGTNWKLDVWAYGVSDVTGFSPEPNLTVPGYTSLNLRVARKLGRKMRLAVHGHDLLESRRLQFVGDITSPTEVERAVYAEIVWGW